MKVLDALKVSKQKEFVSFVKNQVKPYVLKGGDVYTVISMLVMARNDNKENLQFCDECSKVEATLRDDCNPYEDIFQLQDELLKSKRELATCINLKRIEILEQRIKMLETSIKDDMAKFDPVTLQKVAKSRENLIMLNHMIMEEEYISREDFEDINVCRMISNKAKNFENDF